MCFINSGDGNGEGIEEIDSMDFGEASVKIEAPDDSEGPIETIDTSPVSYNISQSVHKLKLTEKSLVAYTKNINEIIRWM